MSGVCQVCSMRRSERLFAIAEYLRGRRTGIVADELAERFDVTVRTIYRDLDSLRAADFPLQAERGRGGGYALDRNYNLPPVNFNAREAAVLILAGRWLVDMRLVPFVETLKGALDKVRSALPAREQRVLVRLRETLSFTGVPARSASPKVRRVIEQAWLENRSLRITYEGAKGRSVRQIQILQIVMERTETLLNCEDLELEAKRQFRLHRIQSANLCEE